MPKPLMKSRSLNRPPFCGYSNCRHHRALPMSRSSSLTKPAATFASAGATACTFKIQVTRPSRWAGRIGRLALPSASPSATHFSFLAALPSGTVSWVFGHERRLKHSQAKT